MAFTRSGVRSPLSPPAKDLNLKASYGRSYRPLRRAAASGHTAVMGSSLGGLVALWMAHKLPETFGKAACLSGAFQVRDRQKKSFVEFVKEREHQDLRIYLDCGTVHDGIRQSRQVREAYLSRGWREKEDFLYFEDKGGEHNERYWRERAWRSLAFLFGAEQAGK